MTPFFSSTFWALTVCDIHFYVWKMSKFIFMRSPLWSTLVCKIPEFWRWKLWDQNLVPLDSGNIHIKESKKPGFTFSVELRTKFVWPDSLSWQKVNLNFWFLLSKWHDILSVNPLLVLVCYSYFWGHPKWFFEMILVIMIIFKEGRNNFCLVTF